MLKAGMPQLAVASFPPIAQVVMVRTAAAGSGLRILRRRGMWLRLETENWSTSFATAFPEPGCLRSLFLGDRGISDVIAYLRVLQGKTDAVKVTGDAMAGRTLFFGKAECSRCHMMDGEGGFIASDLSNYGSGTAPEHIWSAIVEPEKVVSPKSEVGGVRTVEGENVRGVLRAEDNFTLVIQLENGRYRRFEKDRLTDVHHTGKSLMPTDYKSRLSPKELDDLVSYLVRSAISMAPDAARKKTKESQWVASVYFGPF